MALKYREDKATQAAARLLRLGDGHMNHMKLVKLVYLADRAALARWGRPITFDWYFSLPHGPVPSFTLNMINAEPDPENPSYWNRFISERRENTVRLLTEAPGDQLSPAEESLLDEIFQDFGGLSQWQLRDYCHELPEWQDPQGSRLPITLKEILLAQGRLDDEADEIVAELEAEAAAGARLA